MPIIKTKQNDNAYAIAYYRYSSAAQDSISIERQRDAVREYAAERGLTIIKEYADEARSGTDNDRPGFQQMLTEVFQLKPAWLLLWSSSRLGRDVVDVRQAKKLLRMAGCYYDYVSEATPSFTPDGEFMDTLIDANNQKYSYTMSADIIAGNEKKAKMGCYLGNPIYGYTTAPHPTLAESRAYAVDDEQAAWVRYAFEECNKGTPLSEIAETLNINGQRTTRGGKWTSNSINRLLRRDSYIGVYRYSGIELGCETGAMPRIVSDETFRAAGLRVSKNQKNHANRRVDTSVDESVESRFYDYWLSPYLYCGECGEPMSGGTSYSAHSGAYHYYRCNGRIKRKGCKKKHVRAEVIEDMVLDVLSVFTMDTERLASIAVDAQAEYMAKRDDGQRLEGLHKQMRKLERQIDSCLDSICNAGDASKKRLEKRLEELSIEQDGVSAQILVEQSAMAEMADEMTIQAFFDKYRGADVRVPEVRDELMRYFVKAVYLYDDRIVIRGRYDDDEDFLVPVGSNAIDWVPTEQNQGEVRELVQPSHHLQNSRTLHGYEVIVDREGLALIRMI